MRARVRVLLVLFFAAGIAFLGLLAGGEHRTADARGGGDPMAGYFSPGMPRYPDAEESPAGPAGRVGGSRLKMAFFATGDEPDKVARHYATVWRTRRFFVHEDVTHRGGVVSAIDAEQGIIYQVLLEVQEKRTLVFPSESTAPELAATATDPAPLRLFPESRVLLTTGNRELGHDMRIHLSLNDGGLEANLLHYQREARAAGYQPEGKRNAEAEAVGPGHRLLLYRKPDGGELTVNLNVVEGKRVRVHLTEVSL